MRRLPYTAMRMSSYGDSVSLQGPGINLRASRGSLVPSKRFQQHSACKSHSPPGTTTNSPQTSPATLITSANLDSAQEQTQAHEEIRPSDAGQVSIDAHNLCPESNLRDRVVIVTGGGGALGLSMAEALFRGGAHVHCLDILEEPHEDFSLVRRHVDSELGGSLHYHHVDIFDTAAMQQCIADIAARHLRIDGLIAAAGIDDSRNLLDINHIAILRSVQGVGEQMLRYGTPGSMVLVADMSSDGDSANKGPVSSVRNSSKPCIKQLTKSLAVEWGEHGIRVNSLCPGRSEPRGVLSLRRSRADIFFDKAASTRQ